MRVSPLSLLIAILLGPLCATALGDEVRTAATVASMSNCEFFFFTAAMNPGELAHFEVLATELGRLGFHDRAAFIRAGIQHTRARTPREQLEAAIAQQVLLGRNGEQWLLRAVGPGGHIRYRNGLPHEIEMDASRFAAEGDRIVQQTPLRVLELRDAVGEVLAQIAAAGQLQHIEELRLPGCLGSCHNALAGMGGTAAPRLRRLALRDAGLTDSDLRTLAGSPIARQIEALDIAGNYITVEGLRAFLDARLPRPGMAPAAPLRELTIFGNALGPEGVQLLATHPAAQSLEVLNLRGSWGVSGSLPALLQSLNNLRSLDISSCRLNNGDAAHLAQARPANLKELLCENNPAVSAADWARVVRSPLVAGLERLSLSHNWLSREVFGLLRNLPLRELALEYTGMNNLDATALFGAGALPGIERLRLGGNLLSIGGARAIGSSGVLGRVLELDLSNNALGNDGIRALLESGGGVLPPVLHLAATRSGNQAVQLLAEASGAVQLRELDLSQNTLAPNTFLPIRALAQRIGTAPLRVVIRGSMSPTTTSIERARRLREDFPNLLVEE